MAEQTEHEGQSTAAESDKSSDGKKVEGNSAPSNAQLALMLIRMKLKLFANYAIDGFAPAVAAIALIVAVMAINSNKSGLAQQGKSAEMMDSLKASLLASNRELETLKATIAAEKSMQEQENKKYNEMMKKIVQNISPMQLKMKISPTLEEQFRQPASASAVTPTVTHPIPLVAAPMVITAAPAGVNKKPAKQGVVLKDAVEKFNQKTTK